MYLQNTAEVSGFMADMPLPTGYTWTTQVTKQSKYQIDLHYSLWTEPARSLPTRRINRIWMAPVTELIRVASDESQIRLDLKIVELKAIAPPLKALSVNGLYPGEPEYPYYKDLKVSLQALQNEDFDPEILSWFQAIPEKKFSQKIIWVGAVGDLMPGRGVESLLFSQGPSEVFTDTLPILQSFDILLGNLEGTVTLRGEKVNKAYTFRYSPDILPHLYAAGFTYLSLTNNHSFDYGSDGFADTLSNLSSAGIATSGAGLTASEALVPWTTTVANTEFNILSLGAYPREQSGFDGKKHAAVSDIRPGILWEGDAALTAVGEFAGETSVDIVLVHGGNEWESQPNKDQKKLYRQLVDAGADLVLGSHPHVLQGVESYNGGVIAYSLGNFLFPGMEETLYGQESIIFAAGIMGGRVRYLRFFPVSLDGRRVAIDTTGDILKRLETLSLSLN